jgi:hypothetical protein
LPPCFEKAKHTAQKNRFKPKRTLPKWFCAALSKKEKAPAFWQGPFALIFVCRLKLSLTARQNI